MLTGAKLLIPVQRYEILSKSQRLLPNAQFGEGC